MNGIISVDSNPRQRLCIVEMSAVSVTMGFGGEKALYNQL